MLFCTEMIFFEPKLKRNVFSVCNQYKSTKNITFWPYTTGCAVREALSLETLATFCSLRSFRLIRVYSSHSTYELFYICTIIHIHVRTLHCSSDRYQIRMISEASHVDQTKEKKSEYACKYIEVTNPNH